MDDKEKRQQIEELHIWGLDYSEINQYQKAEKFFKQAVELANSLDDLSLIIEAKFWLASMQRLQGKRNAALNIYTWLIEVAYNSELSSKLTETDLSYVADSFFLIVNLGRIDFPEMKIADLEKVIERGLEWLTNIGTGEWSANLRLERGELLLMQEHYQEAREEMEAALAMIRRNSESSNMNLAYALCSLGDLLRKMKKLEESKRYYQEVISDYSFSNYDYEKRRAWKGLAYLELDKEDFVKAERFAEKSLELAQNMESFQPIACAYELLGNIYYRQNKIKRAIEARIQFWKYSRQDGSKDMIYQAYRDLGAIRIYQAKKENSQRFITKAVLWLRRSLSLAIKLDRQVGLTTKQDEIEKMQAEIKNLGEKEILKH